MLSATSQPNGGHTEGTVFGTSFTKLRPLVLAEWPDLTTRDVDDTEGDVERLVTLVATHTGHTRTLVRQHLSELGGFSPAATRPSTLEERLTRLLEALETSGDELPPDRDRGGRGLIGELRDEGRHLAEEVRESVSSTQRSLRDNFWTTLFATLGLGFIAGLLVGHRRER